MRVFIETPASGILLDLDNPMVAGLAKAQLCDTSGYGDSEKFIARESQLVIRIVPESIIAGAPEPLEKLRKDQELTQSNWLKEYSRRTELEKEVKALKAKLESIGQAAA